MLVELLERLYDASSTVLCTQYTEKGWHQRLGSGVHADAIMDRIGRNMIWMEVGDYDMREHTVDISTSNRPLSASGSQVEHHRHPGSYQPTAHLHPGLGLWTLYQRSPAFA